MLDRRSFLASSSACALALAADPLLAAAGKAVPLPPLAPVRPVRETLFGTAVTDDYRWMEGTPANPEFAAWLDAQGNYARARLDALPGRDALAGIFDRYLTAADEAFVTQAWGETRVIGRIAKGKPWVTFHIVEDGKERLVLDPKAEDAKDNLDFINFAPGGGLAAFGLSRGGSENAGLSVLDTRTGVRTKIVSQSSRATGWTGDGKGLFSYRLRPEAKFGAPDYRIGGSAWLHRLGSDPASDVVVFGPGEGDVFEAQSSDEPYVSGSKGSPWLVGSHMLNDTLPNQIYVARADDVFAGKRQWRRIVGPSAKAERLLLDGEQVFVLARGRSGLGEVVAIDAANQTFETGKVLLAGGDGERLRRFTVARDGIYAILTGPARDRLVHVARDGTVSYPPAPPGRRLGTLVADRDSPGAFLESFDWLVPFAPYRYLTPTSAPVAVPLLPPEAFSADAFKVTEAMVPARDGETVPVVIFHRPDIRMDGSNPVLIDAYGSYGGTREVSFDRYAMAAVDAGMVLVYAGVRGGGEKGEAWHEAGMKATKPNTWRDAIDVGRWLVSQKWTSPAHLAIEGTSAGGIMVGRAITEEPALFAAAVGNVGVFNTLRMENTANGPGNVSEFGTVAKEDEFRALLAMDSVQAVRDGVRYPMTLITTGTNDPRVEPWLPGKFAARLQRSPQGRERIWLAVDKDSGHSGSSIEARRRGFVDKFAFLKAYT